MNDVLPKDVIEGLEAARNKKKSRLKVKVGEETFNILRYWNAGFALDIEDAPHLRGLVDVYDGARHLSQCLIVASEEDGSQMVYEFKRATPHSEAPPLDYEIAEDAPVGLISQQ